MSDLDAIPRSPSGIAVPPEAHAETGSPGAARTLGLVIVLVMGAILAFLLWAAPRGDEGIAWGDPMIPGGWMAWTLATALFFWAIAALILLMLVLAIRWPETPRVGILRIETTRGDRLFISLLLAAFVNIAWLGLVAQAQWGALVLSLVLALAVFRWA